MADVNFEMLAEGYFSGSKDIVISKCIGVDGENKGFTIAQKIRDGECAGKFVKNAIKLESIDELIDLSNLLKEAIENVEI